MLYRVTSKREVLEHAPGDVFEADLDAVTEARLVVGGHLERVERAPVENFGPRREDEDAESTDEA